jgi:methylisocitrate lyase
MKDALARALAYRKAGADVIFPEALQSRDEFQAFGRKKGVGVLLANMTEFGRSPALTVQELSRLGFRVILFPMTAFRAAAFAIERAFARLQSTGQTQSLVGQMQTRAELYKLIGYDQRKT